MGIFSDKYRYYYKKLILVSLPVVFGQAGNMITGLVDTFMVGHLGSWQLAAAAFANVVFTLPFIFGIGFSIGLTPLVGHASGSNDEEKCSSLLKHGIVINLSTAILMSLLMLGISFFMRHMGQQAEVADLAIPFFHVLNFSLIPVMLFLTVKQFVDGLGRTIPGMVIGLSMNVLNIILNWALIYGHWGLPQLGMMGSAYATLIARFGMAIVMLLYLYFTPLKVYITNLGNLVLNRIVFWEILKTGFPIGAQFALEVGAFIAGSIMVGTISHQALAAHQIAISLAAFTYLMASGIGTGATIVISNLMGKKEVEDIKTAGRASFLMVLAFMSVCACFFLIFRFQLPGYFNTEPKVMAIATSLLAIAAFFQLSDGLQVTVIGALRGMGDVVAPTWIALFSYWGITLPLSYYCGFILNLGPVGVWIGYLSGLTIAAILLFLRFRYKLTKLELS